MKIICSKSNLLCAVNIVSKAVSTKTTLPILECFLLDASTDEIKLTANDMELGIETIVSGEIEQKGIIALNAKIFSEIVRKLPDSDITIETDETFTTHITCEKAKFNISGKQGDDFPKLPYIEKSQHICLSQFTLKELIQKTIFSISDNDTNKLLTGELFEVNETALKVASLDGHRISIRNTTLKETYETIKAVVPGKTLSEISKILTGNLEDEVCIYFTTNHILFEFHQTIVVSRLIEGEYFKINQMISTDYETKVTINKKELLNCIDRATLLINEGEKKPIILNITDYEMELKIRSSIGSMDEKIDIQKEGKDIMIGFNPKFMIDSLRAIDEEEVNLYLMNSKAPCIIRDRAETYIYLILPVNFNAAV